MIKTFAELLPRLFVESYRHGRWMWHVLAALGTAALVLSGADWWFWEHTRAAWLEPYILVAGIGGFFVPVLVAVGLYVTGELGKKRWLERAGVAVGQATIVSYTITNVYKAFTGRIPPEFLTAFGSTDISREFSFGFLQNGVFNGWPSSHTAVAVAGAVVLYTLWPHPFVRVLVVGWAVFVCLGAAIGLHWLSDVVAGAIVGVVVGLAARPEWYATKRG